MPSFNPERAEVPLALPGGPTLKLVMDYQTIGALVAKFGDQWDTVISTASHAYDFKAIFALIEILASRHHPEITADEIMAYGPPWLGVINAFNAAHNVFLFGHAGPQAAEAKEASDEDSEEDDDEKEAREERPFANGQDGARSSSRRWQRLLRRVYGRPSSGP